MNSNTQKQPLSAALTLCLVVMLTACGGGSSSSGGPPAPIVPPLSLFSTGLYNGSLDLVSEGENVVDDGEPESLVLEVQGNVAGSQQVRIAFAQFSGTSAIGPDGEFSIPSGSFPIGVRNRNGRVISTCRGELLFEGTFSGTSVSGSVTTTTAFTCVPSAFGTFTLTGSFEATLGAAKLAGFGEGITLTALEF